MGKPEQAFLPTDLGNMSPDDGDSQDLKFAFLVHSQQSLGQSTPPEIDNQRLARQKRKRTRYFAQSKQTL